MPSGAKKRKALKQKKKSQQEATGTGRDELGSQDERGSDTSNLSSPSSQGNEEFGIKHTSVVLSAKEISGVADGTLRNGNAITVGKGVPFQDPCGGGGGSVSQVAAVVDSVKPVVVPVSKVVISKDNELVDTATDIKLAKHKDSIIAESVRESQVPVSSEVKILLLPGTPAVRTSWLSCCGLFDVMTGSDR